MLFILFKLIFKTQSLFLACFIMLHFCACLGSFENWIPKKLTFIQEMISNWKNKSHFGSKGVETSRNLANVFSEPKLSLVFAKPFVLFELGNENKWTLTELLALKKSLFDSNHCNAKAMQSKGVQNLKPVQKQALEVLGSQKKEEEPFFLLIHFWASWCPSCVEEIEEFGSLGGALKQVHPIAVSLDTDQQQAINVFKAPCGVLSLIDPSGSIAREYGTYQMPETYLITPSGQILTKWVGPQKWKSDLFLKNIETWMSEYVKIIKSK